MKEFGFTQPVIIDKHNSVVAGHGRIPGAKKAGLKQVPTVCLEELTEEQIKAYRLADNKRNESEWDSDLLKQSLDEIAEMDMEVFGFAMDSLADEELEIEPEVPFTEILNEENNYIVLKFDNKADWISALGVLGIEKVKAFPAKKNGNKETFGEREQFELLQKKWGSNIVRLDTSNKGRSRKNRKYIDYNPIIKIPIKGI